MNEMARLRSELNRAKQQEQVRLHFNNNLVFFGEFQTFVNKTKVFIRLFIPFWLYK